MINEVHPILKNFRWKISYLALWFSVSIVQAILNSLFGHQIGIGMALMDAAIYNALFAVGVLPLWYPIRYHSSKKQQSFFILLFSTLLPYILLACVFVSCWIAAGNHLMLWIIPNPDYSTFLQLSTGWRFVEGTSFFVITILFYTRHTHLAVLTEKIAALQQTIERQKGEVTRIPIRDRQQIHIINIQEINYIEAYGDYVRLYTAKGNFLKENTMKFFEEKLPLSLFVRIHRSYIVNINQVNKIELYEKERYHVHLKNGTILKTSETGYKLLKESLR